MGEQSTRDELEHLKERGIEILFHDSNFVFVTKPHGMDATSMPDRDIQEDSFQDLLEGVLGRFTAYPQLHKFDSGITIGARTPDNRKHIVKQFENDKVSSLYLGLVEGYHRGNGWSTIDKELSYRGKKKPTVTRYMFLSHDFYNGVPVTLIALRSSTTLRSNQFQRHLSSEGLFLAGDQKYNQEPKTIGYTGPVLHHACLRIQLPRRVHQEIHVPCYEGLSLNSSLDSTVRGIVSALNGR